MTRKDFELIAGVIRDLNYRLADTSYAGVKAFTVHTIAKEFSRALQGTNPRFDVERFVAATEVPKVES